MSLITPSGHFQKKSFSDHWFKQTKNVCYCF